MENFDKSLLSSGEHKFQKQYLKEDVLSQIYMYLHIQKGWEYQCCKDTKADPAFESNGVKCLRHEYSTYHKGTEYHIVITTKNVNDTEFVKDKGYTFNLSYIVLRYTI